MDTQIMVQPQDLEEPEDTPGPKMYADSEIQTDLHPVLSNMVEGYSWNEWDYRRRALALHSVHKSVTHSTQTHRQSIGATQGTQTYPLRNHRAQTTRSVYVEAPRNQVYFFGLRGHHCNTLGIQPPHMVELTREPVMDLTKVKFPRKVERARLPGADPN